MNTFSDLDSLLLDENFLAHYGTPRHSGRYPWGSGENPYQHGQDFLSRVEALKKTGWEETPENIRNEFGLTTGQYRTEKSLAKDERRMLLVEHVKSLRTDGLNNSEIGRKLGVNESTVRSLLNASSESKMKQARNTADYLKKQVDSKEMVDVGTGVERELGISKEKLEQALTILTREGYNVYGGRFSQTTNTSQKTTQRVLCKPGIEHQEIYDLDRVKTINDYISRDGGDTFERKFTYPSSLDSKRLAICYAEDGGLEKDGLVEIRRGCPDLSLGESRYSQVRIMVDGKKYIKGMAVYSDDLPDGIDVRFNTNKTKDKSKLEVLKDIKDDPDNPFGSLIKDADQGGQYWYDSKTGERISGASDNPNKKLGLINKRADEGDWDDWKDALPSQFLGKQTKTLAEKQLNLAKANKMDEYAEICSLTNPTVKKYYLEKFADGCDAAAVNLQAAALPHQKYHVIIPIPSLKDNEIYAPKYSPGTKIALIRFPHGGTFEIPICTVNNRNKDAVKTIGPLAQDAVGINATVAARLSGADFDGDTAMVIPTSSKVKITSTPELAGLKGFDPKLKYGGEVKIDSNGEKHYYRDGHEYKVMKNTQTEMGKISNLITDMTLAGADENELARAVRHSMVVIDAEKHKLDYKASEKDNNIAQLRKDYQPKYDGNGNLVRSGGASTILSRAKGETSVPATQGTPKINLKDKSWYDPSRPEGALIYKTADDLYYPNRTIDKKTGTVTIKTADGDTIKYNTTDKASIDRYTPVKRKDNTTGEVYYTDRTGKIRYEMKMRTKKSTKMAETDDAYTLVSEARHPMELLYAQYANDMKELANKARVEMAYTGKIATSKEAKSKYKDEIDSLDTKLNDALKNTVKERTAQRMANVEINEKKQSNPDMKTSDLKKISQQALTKYRQQVGSVARRDRAIEITDREWEAIQSGAISENKLKQILNNANPDVLRERSMPKEKRGISQVQINRIKAYAASDYTLQEIADKMNLSVSAVSKYLKGGN